MSPNVGFQVTEANPANCTRRVSGELDILQSKCSSFSSQVPDATKLSLRN